MYDLLWFLLPVAAFSGWWVARNQSESRSKDCPPVAAQYYQGLNYLLNEQPDKAMDVFVKMLEVNTETVELHLALGNIFRKRGEVDRAIMLHQNLIARPSLTATQKDLVLLELGQDFLAAGLLDRAERLFVDLRKSREYAKQALWYLMDVYQQEKDWANAIDVARQYERVSNTKMNDVVAQFTCEMAVDVFKQGDRGQGVRFLKRALNVDPNCVRANIIWADQERAAKRYKSAIKIYSRVLEQDPAFIKEVLPAIIECYEALGNDNSIASMLNELVGRYQSESGTLLISRFLSRFDSKDNARDVLEHFLAKYPSIQVLASYVELLAEKEQNAPQVIETIRDVLERVVKNGPLYRCEQCGFSGRELHWQCPSCKTWNSIKPI